MSLQRPSTSSMGRTLNQKNQESIGWAPGMANSTARQQQQQQQQRKLGPDSPHHPRLRPSTGAPPRTPVPVIAHHKAILGTRPPTTATTAAKEKPIPGRTVSAGRSPSAEETLHHPHVTQGPEASGAVCAELDPSSSGEMGTRPGESAPCTPFLPIPASDISPPRTAADQVWRHSLLPTTSLGCTACGFSSAVSESKAQKRALHSLCAHHGVRRGSGLHISSRACFRAEARLRSAAH